VAEHLIQAPPLDVQLLSHPALVVHQSRQRRKRARIGLRQHQQSPASSIGTYLAHAGQCGYRGNGTCIGFGKMQMYGTVRG
jgi:hypothetical protein